MEKTSDIRDEKYYLSYGKVTTFIFLLILFFVPIIFLYSLLHSLMAGQAGIFFSSTYKNYLLLLIATPVLAIWSFLRKPVALINSRKMEPLILERSILANHILGWNELAAYKNQITLLRIPEDCPDVFSFGTWRHQYIAIADGAITLWPEIELKAVILHEYGHLINGDAWKVGFASEYVKWNMILIAISSTITSVLVPILNKTSLSNINFFSNIVAPTFVTVIGLILIISLRYLLRLREFSADIFASSHLGSNKSLIDALETYLTLDWIPKKHQELAFMSEAIQNPFTKFSGDHPSVIQRRKVLIDPAGIIEETFGIISVAGLMVGAVMAWFWDSSAFGTLIAGMLFTCIPILLFMIPSYTKRTNDLSLSYLLRGAFVFSNGVTLMWIIFGFFSSLVYVNSYKGVSQFITDGELRFGLAVYLDYLVLIMIAIPVLITCLAFFAVLISNFVPESVLSKAKQQLRFILGWLIELPFVIALIWAFGTWWSGSNLHIIDFLPSIGASLIFIPLVLFLIQFIGRRIKLKESLVENNNP